MGSSEARTDNVPPTGIASTRITWQTVRVTHTQADISDQNGTQDGVSSQGEAFSADATLHDWSEDVRGRLFPQVDDDMEGVAMRAVRHAQPTAADLATPIMVGIPISQWPRPAMLFDDGPFDQELAASEQIVPGGAGSVLVNNPFAVPSQDTPKGVVVSTLPALWRSIHNVLHGGAMPLWWTADDSIDASTTEQRPDDIVPTVVGQLDGMDSPMAMDAAAVDPTSDWAHSDLVARVWQRTPDESVSDLVKAWFSGHREPLSMLMMQTDVSMPARRGRRLMSVNWPLTGAGIGLALLGIVLLSAAIGAVCSRWCLQRQERKAKKQDLHMRFPLGSHFYEVPFLPGAGPTRDLKNRVSHHVRAQHHWEGTIGNETTAGVFQCAAAAWVVAF